MANTKATAKEQRPLIQIDDEIREMTDEEYANYQLVLASNVSISTGE